MKKLKVYSFSSKTQVKFFVFILAREIDDLGPSDTELCKICMDAIADCVFLDCGHMVNIND